MVSKIKTVAFRGIDVLDIDVGVKIASGLYDYMIVGYIFSYFLFLSLPLHSARAGEICTLYGSEYVPQGQEKERQETYDKNVNDINRTLSFILRVEKGDGGHAHRSTFLYFDAYDEGGNKVSSMRFGDTHSNGLWIQRFSTVFGVYCNFDKDAKNDCPVIKPTAGFTPIGVNKDLSQASLETAPYMLIFPETYTTLRYGSYQSPDDWEKYIKFYTKERIYPDFRGYDFWIRKNCGPTMIEDR
ncbi:MAG: hypothetical protein AUJ12_06770 [Alphaproteobacteria bacterium CG1_02_46_17]|nr:MAG: hypothetical protein AUJ12_06770 [Alphaproteobacteria bacterium CG1_02_46_17]